MRVLIEKEEAQWNHLESGHHVHVPKYLYKLRTILWIIIYLQQLDFEGMKVEDLGS